MRNSIHRRRFIQGMGGSFLALPLLEANSKTTRKVSPPGLNRNGSLLWFRPRELSSQEDQKTMLPLSFSNPSILSARTTRFSRGSITTSVAGTTRPSFSVLYSHDRIQGVRRGQRIDRPESRPIRRRPDTLPLAGFGLGQGQRTYLVLDPKRKCHSSDTQPGEALSNALPQGRWPPRAIKSNGIWRTNAPFWI